MLVLSPNSGIRIFLEKLHFFIFYKLIGHMSKIWNKIMCEENQRGKVVAPLFSAKVVLLPLF